MIVPCAKRPKDHVTVKPKKEYFSKKTFHISILIIIESSAEQ